MENLSSEVMLNDGEQIQIELLPRRLTMEQGQALIGREIVSNEQLEDYQRGTVVGVLDWPITGGVRAFTLNPGHPTVCPLEIVVGIVKEG